MVDLPADIIERIIELAQDTGQLMETKRFVVDLGLVSRQWTEPSRRIAWRHLRASRNEDDDAGMRTIAELGPMLFEVPERLQHLRKLELIKLDLDLSHRDVASLDNFLTFFIVRAVFGLDHVTGDWG